MKKKFGAFRFTYFTEKYTETCDFFTNKLSLKLEHAWDRNEHDKGSLFKAGNGLVEVLHKSTNEEHLSAGLDYRVPQGVFMCIQVFNVDELFEEYKKNSVLFKQELTNQTWGHRSFSVLEPNGLVLFSLKNSFSHS